MNTDKKRNDTNAIKYCRKTTLALKEYRVVLGLFYLKLFWALKIFKMNFCLFVDKQGFMNLPQCFLIFLLYWLFDNFFKMVILLLLGLSRFIFNSLRMIRDTCQCPINSASIAFSPCKELSLNNVSKLLIFTTKTRGLRKTISNSPTILLST